MSSHDWTIVYLIRAGDFAKLGVTTNLKARVRSLKTGSPFELDVMASTRFADDDEARSSERELLDRFAHRRSQGEWFLFHSSMLSAVLELGDERSTFARSVVADFVKQLLIRPPLRLSDAETRTSPEWDRAHDPEVRRYLWFDGMPAWGELRPVVRHEGYELGWIGDMFGGDPEVEWGSWGFYNIDRERGTWVSDFAGNYVQYEPERYEKMLRMYNGLDGVADSETPRILDALEKSGLSGEVTLEAVFDALEQLGDNPHRKYAAERGAEGHVWTPDQRREFALWNDMVSSCYNLQALGYMECDEGSIAVNARADLPIRLVVPSLEESGVPDGEDPK